MKHFSFLEEEEKIHISLEKPYTVNSDITQQAHDVEETLINVDAT